MLRALESMMGKRGSIDGVCCGVVSEIGLEQTYDHFPILTLKLILTDEIINNLSEYGYMTEVMSEKGNN